MQFASQGHCVMHPHTLPRSHLNMQHFVIVTRVSDPQTVADGAAMRRASESLTHPMNDVL
jgi:hypothetical protein